MSGILKCGLIGGNISRTRLPLALDIMARAEGMVLDFTPIDTEGDAGFDFPSTVERHAVLVSKILAGADPAQLPLERPTKFHLVVNLKTAKELGITIPQSILLRADEVIR